MVKICIISQGGKATARYNGQDYESDPRAFEEYLKKAVSPDNVDYDVVSLGADVSGVDSCHPPDCNNLAKTISDLYKDYDGFLILRGEVFTDYVATFLAFTLQGNYKPILFADGNSSFENPISDTVNVISKGLKFLFSDGQRPNLRSNVSILSNGLIIKAVDAERSAYPSGGYYSRTGKAYGVERLAHAKDIGVDEGSSHLATMGELQDDMTFIPLNEDLNIGYIDGVQRGGGLEYLGNGLKLDALVVSTTTWGGVTFGGDDIGSSLSDFVSHIGHEKFPIVFVNTCSKNGLEKTPWDVANSYNRAVNGGTMSRNAALVKLRYALTIAGDDIGKFRGIMKRNQLGESPTSEELLFAPGDRPSEGAKAFGFC